jgi:nucleotide-binding universal stress UspA family protein
MAREMLKQGKKWRIEMKILVAFDGSLNAGAALRYGLNTVKEKGGRLIALHVFNSGMFIDYDAHPGAEDFARREALGFVEDARRMVAEAGASSQAEVLMQEGNPEEEIAKFAREQNMDLIITPPRYKAVAKNSPCPVSIVPGYILIPLDKIENFMKGLALVTRETSVTGSKVILFGVVAVHMYSRSEKKEVAKIEREIFATLKKAKKILQDQGIDTKDLFRSGYPDEEIARVAEEYPITMIIVPEGGDTPSELGKAAAMLIDDRDKFKKPVLLVPAEKTAP